MDRRTVGLIAGLYFVNALDFLIVAPLGPHLQSVVPGARMGILSSSYALSAFASGLWGAFFLDRFDRRRALQMCSLCLGIATACCALAETEVMLVLARCVAGAFGGPATSLAISAIADSVEETHRGRAMALVSTAFAAANVAGIPLSLVCAESFGWRAPFLFAGTLGVVLSLSVTRALPRASPRSTISGRWVTRQAVAIWLSSASAMFSGFLVIPILAVYLRGNLRCTPEEVESAFLVGGLVNVAAMLVAGPGIDRFGARALATVGALLFAATMLLHGSLGAAALLAALAVANTFRQVSQQTLAANAAEPSTRARFMSVQSSVQHAAAALGAASTVPLLSTLPDGTLNGVATVAALALVVALIQPLALATAGR